MILSFLLSISKSRPLGSESSWVESMDAIEKWSAYASQAELNVPRRQGTRVIIYNLWEDEEGLLELDFTTDPYDIQIRTTSRDDKSLKKLAARFASCRHYLTYRHSLRSYTSILYLRLPSRFRIFLRGKQVQHHSLRNEMMGVEEVTYRPKDAGHSKAVVTLGFVKDAKEHLDISGFNVYHKNRLIKPFWRIWNPSDTRGRGIIGILEANFVEPAHDKQGFERTIVLSRLEARLVEMQRSYWSKHCHKIGYTNTSLKKVVPSVPVENNTTANGGRVETGHRDAQHTSVVDRGDANVLSVANRGRDVSHIQAMTRKEPETVRIASAVGMLPGQGASVNSARLEMQEQSRLRDSMDSRGTGVGNNSVSLHRQDSAHVGRLGVSSDSSMCHVQDVSLHQARLGLHTVYPPGSSAATLGLNQNASLSTAKLDFQAPCPPFSTGMASIIIDLDSPDVDQKCEDAASVMPFPQNCDAPKQITEDCRPEFACLSRGADACENALPSRERSNDAAGSLEGDEVRRLIDACMSFPTVTVLGEAEALPERPGFKSCGQFSDALDNVTILSEMETRSERLGMESRGQASEIVASVNEVSTTTHLAGFKDLPDVQRNGDMFELGTESFSQGKTMLENVPCKNTTMINVADAEASDLLRSSIPSDEAHVSAIFELDDLFKSSTPQKEVPQHSPQSNRDGDALVASPVMNMDLVLPDISGNAMLENDSMGLFHSPKTLGGNDISISTVRDDGEGEEHGRLPEIDIQQVARMLPETDAAMNDFEGREGDCLLPKQALETKPEIQDVTAPVIGQLSATPPSHAVITSSLEQEGTSNLKQGAIKDVSTPSEGMQEAMVIVPQEGRSIYSLDILGTIQASNQAMQQELVSVPALAVVDVGMSISPSSSCDDLLGEDLTCRLLLAKQQIESLQQSIEAVVAETNDMREQLQQQSQLQDLDMRNLNRELERALSCLEELKG